MPSAVEGLSLEAVERISTERNEPEWLREKRRAGWAAFESLPTPDWTRGIRGWWSGTIRPLAFEEMRPFTPAGQNLPDFELSNTEEGTPSGIVVQYNSQVVRVELSEEARAKGVILSSLEDAVKTHPELVQKYFMTEAVPLDETRFTAANAALWTGGVFLYVPNNVVLDVPFRVVFYSDVTDSALFTHTLVVTGKNAKARLIEDHISNGQAGDPTLFDSNVTEVFVGDGSVVEYYNPQEYGQNVVNISTKRAIIMNNATHRWTIATLGSDTTRLTLESFLSGQGSHTDVTGLSYSVGNQNFDVYSRNLHRVPNTSANALFKAALDDASQLGFRGAIRTLKGAQNTDSFLEDHTLYLSKDSKADVLPSLDVDANDVRCSHGASIGMIDADQIFYLMSRGLTKKQAEEMIVAGFFEEVIERIPLESVKERVRRAIEAKLH
ncbi:MAG TPA: Fe-S cluster assembly protein SufD [Chloroflexia bacterium]|nr:Fe-S cluster assembly protein SufD [Chloroflexia bacterium]